ncbi:MAG: hypothetical protein FJW39_19965 [Acidobacteria bacterium]|nr:hypothetical protein [Acidobacteriota bacterium]
MRFLIDNSLPPDVARRLTAIGYDAVHVRTYGMQAADDLSILERAAFEDRTIVSLDSDFAMLLAVHVRSKPSFILFREPGMGRVRALSGASSRTFSRFRRTWKPVVS